MYYANCILRSFTSGDENLLLRAFVVYVRPIVEYNSIIWSPCFQTRRRFDRESSETIY